VAVVAEALSTQWQIVVAVELVDTDAVSQVNLLVGVLLLLQELLFLVVKVSQLQLGLAVL
jgi:hypothetical protein